MSDHWGVDSWTPANPTSVEAGSFSTPSATVRDGDPSSRVVI